LLTGSVASFFTFVRWTKNCLAWRSSKPKELSVWEIQALTVKHVYVSYSVLCPQVGKSNVNGFQVYLLVEPKLGPHRSAALLVFLCLPFYLFLVRLGLCPGDDYVLEPTHSSFLRFHDAPASATCGAHATQTSNQSGVNLG
jgi:hypothetical protein